MRHTWIFGLALACVGSGPALAASLYDDGSYRGLVTDHRALRVGDALTVVVYESSSAKSSTASDTRKSLDLGVSASDQTTDVNGQLNASNKFQGGGSLTREDAVVATVSVTVTEVLPSGDLRVRGEQRIKFNEESQFISVEGRVRPADISKENTVLSSRLADAQINYTGDGLLSNRQSPGWFTRMINWLF